jgi:hypothetical protein
MDAAANPDSLTGGWSPLVDLSDRPFLDLIQGGDDALARSARRVIRALDDPDGIISAFQSFTS